MTDGTVGIVGAGIVGLAIGREICRRRPGTRVVVLEKEDRVAAHQTGHNSGVVHAGIYYQPSSLKARLCARGRALLREYCASRSLPFQECGKLVVAVTADEVPRLDALATRALENGVPGLRRVGRTEIHDLEPYATGLAALWSPRTAITDFPAIARAFADDIIAAGGEVRLGSEVTRILPGPTVFTNAPSAGPAAGPFAGPGAGPFAGPAVGPVAGPGAGPVAGPFVVDRLIICAGLQSDLVAGLAGDSAAPRIVPFRGEYMRVRSPKDALVRGLIYPVPDPRYPFLGVHFTRRVDGTLEVGPNAVLATAREGYRRRDISLPDLAGTAVWPGTWRMAARHWRTGAGELRGSLSKTAYMRAASRYVPEIGPADVVRAGSGVRAQALDRDGTLVDDFRIHQLGPVIAVRNAPSPAATSSMAIAEHVADVLET